MIVSNASLHKIGWAMILTICGAMLLALTFKVNAVKSQVRLTERQILAVRQDKDLLETEFQTRANQHQLASLNDVDFGYSAPTPGQYLDGERQLVALGKPRPEGAPAPIMVASVDTVKQSALTDMVSPLTGKAMAAEVPKGGPHKPASAAGLSTRLSAVNPPASAIPRDSGGTDRQ